MGITQADLPIIGLIIFLEGVLSIDNAVVLALLAQKLPRHLQKKALTYGLIGAVVFRITALFIATYLMKWLWVKFVGGAYLLWVGGKYFVSPHEDSHEHSLKPRAGFWSTVLVIELTDIAFALDSILAAIAITNKFWVVVSGGIIGLILMRFAASIFISLLRRFPNFQTSAYLLVVLIGVKLIVDGLKIEGVNFHSSSSPAFWIFWGLMLLCIGLGFVRKKGKRDMTYEKALNAEATAGDDLEKPFH